MNPWIEVDPETFVPIGAVVEEQTSYGYTARIYEDDSICCCGDSLEVLRDNQRVYAARAYLRLRIGASIGNSTNEDRRVPMGQDITGDAIPDLIITQWTGGAHCCSYYRVFELGSEFRLLGTIYGGHYDSRLEDVDEDGNWEFVVHDWAFRPYGPWAECCVPGPYAILHYANDGYHLAQDLMRTPSPTTEELRRLAQEISEHGYHYPDYDPEFWEATMGLIYSGHAELVDPFWDMLWPEDQSSKEKFRRWFLSILPESLYWPEMKDLSTAWPWPEE